MKSQSDDANAGSADLIFQLRQTLGLTQERLAQKLGVSFPTINRWENGRSKPSPLAMKQIEDLLRDLGSSGEKLLRKYFGEN